MKRKNSWILAVMGIALVAAILFLSMNQKKDNKTLTADSEEKVAALESEEGESQEETAETITQIVTGENGETSIKTIEVNGEVHTQSAESDSLQEENGTQQTAGSSGAEGQNDGDKDKESLQETTTQSDGSDSTTKQNTTTKSKNNTTGSQETATTKKASQTTTQTTQTKSANVIQFKETSIQIDGEGMTKKDNVVTITKAGTYEISGTLKDGRVIVNAPKEDNVELVLNQVNLTCTNQAPIYVMSANNITLNLKEGTTNTVTDGGKYIFSSSAVTEPNAAIFSEDDIKVTGSGTLKVTGNYADGIASKNDVVISGGKVEVTALDDGIRGKDSVQIKGGEVNVTSTGHGVKVTNEEDTTKGYMLVSGGMLNVESEKDGLHVTRLLNITGGTVNVKAGNEGIDVDKNITISGGEIGVAGSKGENHGALAYGGTCNVTGGKLWVTGSVTYAKNISSSSSQKSIMYQAGAQLDKNTVIALKDNDGKEIFAFTSQKKFQTVLLSLPQLNVGKTYGIYINGKKIKDFEI